MKSALRASLLLLALAGLIVFFSFHIERTGPKQTVTVGFNLSPWLTWTKVSGLGDFGKKVEVNFFTWSAAGLVVAVAAFVVRVRIK